jgi:ribosomal protein S18 acetylase RimI-like enzyme
MLDCMTTPTLRRAQVEDAAAMLKIARAQPTGTTQRMQTEPAPMKFDYRAVVVSPGAWVAEIDGTIVGFVVSRAEPDHLLIENVAVSPAAQGMGIGSLLLAKAEQDAQDSGIEILRLYTNEVMVENIEYYTHRGYRETHRATQDDYHRVFFESCRKLSKETACRT